MTAKANTRRRLTSFSLRTLLITFTVFGVWLGLHLPSVKPQQSSVEAIKTHGGYILYDCEVIDTPSSGGVVQHQTQVDSPVPQWLLSTLGYDHFHPAIHFSTYKGIDRDRRFRLHSKRLLQHLNGLPHLQVLELHLTPVDEGSLKSISELKHLRKLMLGRAMDITDGGMSYLLELQELEHLELNYSRLTDKSIETVSALENLEVLQLEGEFSGKALRHLRHLENLQKLTLLGFKSTELSDEGLIALDDLIGLKELRLQHIHIREDGVRHPKPLENLRGLSVR